MGVVRAEPTTILHGPTDARVGDERRPTVGQVVGNLEGALAK